MINTYKELKFYIKADSLMSRLDTYGGLKSFFHVNIRKKYLRTLRITEWLHNGRKNNLWMWIPYLLYSRQLDKLSYMCGFDIPLNVLGYGVNIPHHGSIIINSKTRIGNYCAIMNNVCFADSNNKVVGDGVLIGTSVVVTKKVVVSDGVQIAAHSLINKNILDSFCIVGGIPQRVLKSSCNYWYLGDEETRKRYLQCETLRKEYMINTH